jgi:hypothetical protein
MTRAKLACIASAVSLLPLAAAGTATASGTQAIGQSAGSHQVAGSAAGSVQVAPTNTNISVRIGSPGNDGAVTQTNSSSATSAAGNKNTTSQTAGQSGVAQQAIGQDAHNAQAALSAAGSAQLAPKNENISVRIHSPGDNGPVTQSNTSSAQSAAGNENATTQSAEQSGRGGGAQQEIGQGASSAQAAKSIGLSLQKHPVNANTPVRIKSAGGGGPVTQSNSSSAASAAGNHNTTTQSAAQAAGGIPLGGRTCDACEHGHGTVVQAIGQDAVNEQLAESAGLSLQLSPVNTNAGDGGGAVDQRNTSNAASSAGNENATSQTARQSAGRAAPKPSRVVDGCDGCGDSPTVQAIGQSVANRQAAFSAALSKQICPVNENAGYGAAKRGDHEPPRLDEMLRKVVAGGAVAQLNASSGSSASGNENSSGQEAGQGA